jgi:hypothetical protein
VADITFREAPAPAVEQPKVDLPEPEPNNEQVQTGHDDSEPVELRDKGGSIVLEALNINEDVNSIPSEDRANLQEVKNYVLEIIKTRGIAPTVSSFTKTLNGLKSEMGLAEEAEPSIVLDRIAGVVKAWRNLSFINDGEEKRRIFFKLANLKSSKRMNEEVLKLMENYKVWQ